jgi:hypothetical protein
MPVTSLGRRPAQLWQAWELQLSRHLKGVGDENGRIREDVVKKILAERFAPLERALDAMERRLRAIPGAGRADTRANRTNAAITTQENP